MLFYLNDYSVYEDISLHILRKGRMRRIPPQPIYGFLLVCMALKSLYT